MQMTMTLEDCSRCGLTILPGEPAMQTASVDPVSSTGQAIIDGRAASSPVRSYHIGDGCEAAAKRRHPVPEAA